MAENNEFYRLNLVLNMEDRLSNSLKGVDKQVQRLEKGFDKARQATAKLGDADIKTNALDKIAHKLDNLGNKTVRPTVTVNDQSTRTINNINNNLRQTTGNKWGIDLSIKDGVTNKLNSVKEALISPMGMMGMGMATMGAGAIVSGIIGTYKEFTHQMKAVQAISGATDAEFEQLTAKAREMGATTSFSATEAGKAFEYMAMAGWKTDQMMAGIPGVLSLAAASGEELGKVSDIVTDAMTAFHMAPEEATHFSDVLAQTATNANTNVGLMGYTFQQFASTAGTLGYTIEDVSLAIGLAANSGIKAEKAGTGLLAMINSIISPTKEAANALDMLGLSIADEAGNVKPLRTLLTDLRTSFAGLTEVEKAQVAETIAGRDGMKVMQVIATASQQDFDKLATSIEHSSDTMEYNGKVYQGAAQKIAAMRMDSLAGDIQLLDSAWKEFQIGLLMDGGGDSLREFVQSATKTIGEFGDLLKSPEFKELDWDDQIIYLLDRAIDKLDAWASGTGGAKFGKVLTKLAELGIRAFVTALTGLLKGAVEAAMNGNLAGAAGLGLAASTLPGAGLLMSGVGSAAKKLFYSPPTTVPTTPTAGGTAGAFNWGRLGTAAKWAGKIAKPVQALIDANRLYESEDKVKTGSEIAGGWAGMLAGAKLGALGGGLAGGALGGVGAIPGVAIGGLLGAIGGYWGGSELGGGIVDWMRGLWGGDENGESGDSSGIAEQAAYIAGKALGTLSELPTRASELFSQLPTIASEKMSAMYNAATGWAGNIISGVSDWFSKLPDNISAFFDGAINTIKEKAASVKASFSLGFSAGATEGGHANGGIFSQEHIARFAEGNKPEAIIPLDISKRSRGLSILGQVQNIFGLGNEGGSGDLSVLAQARQMFAEYAELLANAGSSGEFTPAMAMATAGGGDSGSGMNGGGPSFNFSGINFSFGSDIDEEDLAIAIGRRFLAEIRQGQENRG